MSLRAPSVTRCEAISLSKGIGNASFRRLSRYARIASLAIARASSRVSPSVTRPGKAGHVTTYPLRLVQTTRCSYILLFPLFPPLHVIEVCYESRNFSFPAANIEDSHTLSMYCTRFAGPVSQHRQGWTFPSGRGKKAFKLAGCRKSQKEEYRNDKLLVFDWSATFLSGHLHPFPRLV